MRNLFLISLISLIFATISLNAQDVVPVIQSGHSGSIMFVEWDNTGRYIASADDNNEIIIYDIVAGKVFYRTKFPGKKLLTGIKFDDDGKLYASNTDNAICFDPTTLETSDASHGVPPKKMSANFKIRNSSLKNINGGSLFNRNAYTKFTYAAESEDRKYIIAGDENGGLYFCNNLMNLQHFENVHSLPINDISFSKQGNMVAIASADRSVSIWRLPSYKMEKRLVPRSFNISALASSPDSKSFAFGDELGYAYRITFTIDKLICEAVDTHDGQINDIQVSANSSVAVTAGSDNSAAVVDFENKKVLQKFKAQSSSGKVKQVFDIKAIQEQAMKGNDMKDNMYDENVYSVAVSPDGKYIMYSAGKYGLADPVLKYANISSLNILGAKNERVAKKGIAAGMALPNNIHIYKQMCFDTTNNLYGIEADRKIYRHKPAALTGFGAGIECEMSAMTEASNAENVLILRQKDEPTMEDYYMLKIDPSNGDVYKCKGYEIERLGKDGKNVTYKGQYGYISDFIVMKGQQFLIAAAKDASLNIYDIQSGKKLLSIYVVDGGKLIYVTPEHYYMATGDAITGLGYYHEGRIYPAEQFDIKFNRPDLVLKSLDVFDNEIIDVYKSAYKKRIQRLGFTESMLNGEMELPEIKIMNMDEIKLTTSKSTIDTKLSMKDNNYNLNRLNVYVNDVPLYGTNGMDLSDRYSRETMANIEIPLSNGRNTIQLSCVNEKGMESLKEEIEVFYEPQGKKQKPTLYLISLAVAEYSQSEYNLRYTINDGRGFVKLFSEHADNFDHVVVDSLYNANCTKQNFLALKEKLMKSNVDDYVYVHIAGHGLLDDDLNWYFATQNIDFFDPSVNGLKYEDIEGLLDGIPARNKMLLMDACHSGEVDKQDGVDIAEKADGDDTRGAVTVSKRKKTKNSLGNSFELMRLLFSDLKKGTGTVVISAASGGGYALENESIENGIFTYCLMDAFKKNKADKNKDKSISVSELRNFIFDGVNRMSEGKQQPTSRRENLQNDFNVK
ncbi:MAG: caspase family protein [Bacteroidales bacterium]|nr:caspase family protein [Bacteroidales bacterium]